jgi:hypothetical protein
MEEFRWRAFVPALVSRLCAYCCQQIVCEQYRKFPDVHALCVVADKSRMEPLCQRANAMRSPVRRIGHSCCAYRTISRHCEIRGGPSVRYLVGHEGLS